MAAKKTGASVGTKPKRLTKTAKATKRPAKTTKQFARATKIATRMPLVHYPARTKIDDWSRWPDGLMSLAARGKPTPPDNFERLSDEHVFFYGGPSCFFKGDSIGDAVLYFDPTAEEGQTGGASPFDSGALEGLHPRLRPWAQMSLDERWEFFEKHAMTLDVWRAAFAQWLAASYDAPHRYLEASLNRWAAGQPDRLDPPEILEHNGTRGRAQYGDACADRRAWTWEIRIAQSLPFAHVSAVHVPFRQARKAYDVAARMRWASGVVPDVKTLRRGEEATPETLYVDSERVLRELIGL